jgi:nicotinate dehydrogenase subunit A
MSHSTLAIISTDGFCASSAVSDAQTLRSYEREQRMTKKFEFSLNGKPVSISLDNEETPLLNVLRNDLGVMGTRYGCGLDQCGCCMVLIDGAPEKCCTKPVWSVAGKGVTTVEGLGTPERPHPLQQAFIEEQAGQCGYCLAGILIAAKALLERNASPTRLEIAQALDGNICRCGAHNRIMRAVEKAAARMREGVRPGIPQ